MNARAQLERLTAWISQEFPVLARGLLGNQLAADDPLWEWATLAFEHVMSITEHDERRIELCAEAFVACSLDFLRLQARFMKTGRYAHASANESSALYADAERMTDYLDGLALTYAMWPNHTRMLQFYAEDFVPVVPRGGCVLEIGPGHGLLAAVLLEHRADVRYVGIDISPRSVEYSAAALAGATVAVHRYELVVADARDLDAVRRDPGFAAAVCCEVLEHVDDPRSLLGALAARIVPGAPAFVSTVANMEAEDHVYLFHDADDIRAALEESGFAVHADQPLELAGLQAMTPIPLNYSAIVYPNDRGVTADAG